MNNTINLLKSHRSIRKFKNKPIQDEMIKEIIECAQSVSTSSFIQAYSIIAINNKENRKAIAILAGNQPYIEESPLFLVFCADLNRHRLACEMNDKVMEEGYTEGFILATVDATLAAQNALIAAESLGLGGVYIGGIRNNPNEISRILKLPSNVYPVFGMCIGYPDDNPDKKQRLPQNVIFKIDEYNEENDKISLKQYDKEIKDYYIKRTDGKRSDTWTSQVAKIISKPQRPHMKEFLEKQGFKMK